jgi:orotidine-5'-phosphate decarboxylase
LEKTAEAFKNRKKGAVWQTIENVIDKCVANLSPKKVRLKEAIPQNPLPMNTDQRKTEIILALDVESRLKAKEILSDVGEDLRWIKIGLQTYLRDGSDFIRELADGGYKVFLDLKLHDIPNTVAKAIESLSGMPIGMLTMHSCAGSECIRAAVAAVGEHLPQTKLLGVTVLTSLDDAALKEIGIADSAETQVQRLAGMATLSGVDGIVCSPLELEPLRRILPAEISLVTPGIRPSNAAQDEQKRVMSPAAAAQLGADFLVIGRPILSSTDSRKAFQSILMELSEEAS